MSASPALRDLDNDPALSQYVLGITPALARLKQSEARRSAQLRSLLLGAFTSYLVVVVAALAAVAAHTRTESQRGSPRDRGFVREPALILADEPTGALDSKNAEAVLGHLRKLAAGGAVVVIATHSGQVRSACDQVLDVTAGN